MQQRGVQHGPPERPGRVQAARERDHAVAGGAAVGRLGADDAADRGGLADRAAGVGADGQRRLVGRHRGGGPAGRAARDLVQVPRVAAGAVRGVLGGRAHGELVHVGLAHDDRAGLLQPLGDRRVVRRVPALQDARAAGGRHADGGEHVLDRDRDARQRAERLALPRRSSTSARLGQRAVRGDVQEGVHAVVDGGDPVQVGPGHLGRGDLAFGQRGGQLGRGHAGQFHG